MPKKCKIDFYFLSSFKIVSYFSALNLNVQMLIFLNMWVCLVSKWRSNRVINLCYSRAERASTTLAAIASGTTRSVYIDERRRGGMREFKRTLVPVVLHQPTPQGGAISDVEIWPMHAAKQHYGNRQHLRISSQITILGSWMGKEYTLLSWPPGNRSGRPPEVSLEWTLCAQCKSMFNATSCGTSPGSSGTSCITNGCWSCGGLHGPYQDLPGASGKA